MIFDFWPLFTRTTFLPRIFKIVALLLAIYNINLRLNPPALTYFRSPLRHYYRRCWSVLLLCSVWEEVVPLSYKDRKIQAQIRFWLPEKWTEIKINRKNNLSLKIYSGPISTDELNTLRCVHFPPINLVVYKGSHKDTLSWGGLGASDAFSAYPVGM